MKPANFAWILLAALPLAAPAIDSKQPVAKKPAAEKSTSAKDPTKDQPHCVDQTASRIKSKDGTCAHPGRVITREDLQRTGEIDVGDALRKIDPSFN